MTTAPTSRRTWSDRARSAGRAACQIVIGGALALGTLILSPLLRRTYNRWGATDAELASPMPGDDLVLDPKLGYTRAITIQAPPQSVWPWLVQFGRGRGGFYSYDGLENLVGCDIHSVDGILPGEQDPHVGDLIRSGPEGKRYAAWQILEIGAPHHLVLMGADPETGAAPDVVTTVPDQGYAGSTWQWLLAPADEGEATRLIVRQRLTYSPNQRLLWRIVEPLNFVMERKMLHGIKRRVEAHRTAGRAA
jgi:hypothetical protein